MKTVFRALLISWIFTIPHHFCEGSVIAPYVYWSMDLIEDFFLRPDIGDNESYFADLGAVSGVESVPGVRGDALKIDARSEMNIARVQSHHRNCFVTPSDCTDTGLTFGVWLNLQQSKPGTYLDCIFTSGTSCDEPGVSLYQRQENTIYVSVRFFNGTFFSSECSFLSNQWTHLGVTWDARTNLKMFLDGAEVLAYTSPPSREEADPRPRQFTMKLGSKVNTFSFLVDDLKLWNQALDADFLMHITSPAGVTSFTTSGIEATNPETSSDTEHPFTEEDDHVVRTLPVTATYSASETTPTLTATVTNSASSVPHTESNQTAATVTSFSPSVPHTESNQTALWILVGFIMVGVLLPFYIAFITLQKRKAAKERRCRDEPADADSTLGGAGFLTGRPEPALQLQERVKSYCEDGDIEATQVLLQETGSEEVAQENDETKKDDRNFMTFEEVLAQTQMQSTEL